MRACGRGGGGGRQTDRRGYDVEHEHAYVSSSRELQLICTNNPVRNSLHRKMTTFTMFYNTSCGIKKKVVYPVFGRKLCGVFFFYS